LEWYRQGLERRRGSEKNAMYKIINDAEKLCEKFINKVETGRARSKETYVDCKDLLEKIKKFDNSFYRRFL
jgi:hypothetical protein